MKRLRPIPRLILPAAALALVALTAAAMPSRHSPKKEAREEIASLEQQWRAATIAGDLPTMDRLLSEDFVGISMTGQINTKSMMLDRIHKHSLLVTRLDLSDEKIKLLGRVAIVTSLAEIDGTNEGTPIHGTFRYTRIYQRLATGLWKITNYEATRVPQTRDKPTPP